MAHSWYVRSYSDCGHCNWSSMSAVVGLLASTTQLAAYTISITTSIHEIYHRIQDAPRKTQCDIRRLSQLLHATHLIKSNRLLQTAIISTQVQKALCVAQTLAELLEKTKREYSHDPVSKYWAIMIGRRDKEIAESFERLEQEKSALLISIQIAHTELLGNIQTGVDKVVGEKVSLLDGSEAIRLPEQSNLVSVHRKGCLNKQCPLFSSVIHCSPNGFASL